MTREIRGPRPIFSARTTSGAIGFRCCRSPTRFTERTSSSPNPSSLSSAVRIRALELGDGGLSFPTPGLLGGRAPQVDAARSPARYFPGLLLWSPPPQSISLRRCPCGSLVSTMTRVTSCCEISQEGGQGQLLVGFEELI